MANIASSKKDARRSAERAVRNRSIRSSVKTKVTKVRRALAEGGADNVAELTALAVAGLDRAAAKGVLHPNNAARRKSRLVRRAQAEGTAEAAPAKPKATGRTATANPAAKAKTAAKKPAVKKAAAKSPAKKTTAKPAAKK